MVESPARELGDSIDLVGAGIPCVVEGRVTDLNGAGLPGATVDVWQSGDKGLPRSAVDDPELTVSVPVVTSTANAVADAVEALYALKCVSGRIADG